MYSLLSSSIEVIAYFEVLCGVRSVGKLSESFPSICNTDDAVFIDDCCDWTAAKHWAQWWTRATHLKMLSNIFSSAPESWKNCPTSTNAVEGKNQDCKTYGPHSIRFAMINVYQVDKNVCYKHIAAEHGSSISYRCKNKEMKINSARARQRQRKVVFNPDRIAQYSPPDRVSNFVSESKTKTPKRSLAKSSTLVRQKRRAICRENSIECIPDDHSELLGKSVKVKFQVDEKREEWFNDVIDTYNLKSGEYGVYFPCDGETVEMPLDDEDLVII